MSTNKRMAMLSLIALAMGGGMAHGGGNMYHESETPEEKARKKEAFKKQNMLSKGLKEFEIKGQIIYALNEKTALKKYKKLNPCK